MTITDETLCAFLDGELAPEEESHLRNQLAIDEILAERLETLAAVDRQMQVALSVIDNTPIPENIRRLTAELDMRNKVVKLSLWKRTHQNFQHYAVAAASLTAVVGFVLGHSLQNETTQAVQNWQSIAAILENQAGGISTKVSDTVAVTTNLTFFNQEGEYCRQFSVNTVDARKSQNIACRSEGEWRLQASIPEAESQGDYQAASGPGPIDQILDIMMKGQVLNADDEKNAINSAWSD